MNAGTSCGKQTRGKSRLKLVLIIIAAAGLVLAAHRYDIQPTLRGWLAWVDSLGPAGLLVFVGLYVLACVALLPGSVLTLGAGAVFGVVRGSIAVSAGATLGAGCAFLVGRYLARGWVAGRIAGNARFAAVDEAVAREGWKIVLLTRLSPVFPFNLLNYAFGLTRVSLRHFFFASWLGMLPGTVMYVYIGSLVGDLAGLGAAGRTRGLAEWALYAVGLLATLAVTLYVTKIARKALAGRIKG